MDEQEKTLLKGQHTLQKIEDLFMSVDRTVPRWPALFRYTHGQRLYTLLNEMEALCVAANKKYFKKTTLQDLDIRKAQLELLVRRIAMTTYEDKKGARRLLLPPGLHAEWSAKIAEIGNLIGGWKGSLNERGNAVNAKEQA